MKLILILVHGSSKRTGATNRARAGRGCAILADDPTLARWLVAPGPRPDSPRRGALGGRARVRALEATRSQRRARRVRSAPISRSCGSTIAAAIRQSRRSRYVV